MKPTVNDHNTFKLKIDLGDLKGTPYTGQRRSSIPPSEPFYEEIKNDSEVFKEMKVDQRDTGQYRFAGLPFLPGTTTKLRVGTDSEFMIDPGETKDSGQRGSSCRQSELLYDDAPTMDTGQLHPPGRRSELIVGEPVAMQPLVNYISVALENIRTSTFYIAVWEVCWDRFLCYFVC
jgi:hypothetical protein